MRRREQQDAELLDKYWVTLANDPTAAPPAELDPEIALVTQRLVGYLRPPEPEAGFAEQLRRRLELQEPTASGAMTKTIGIVLFPEVTELDFVGPLEVFGGLAKFDTDWRVVTVAESQDILICANGLRVKPDHSFADCPPLDILLVPGGKGSRRERENPKMLDFVAKAASGASYVTSVCTGAFVLHAAGLLTGKRATTYWASVGWLKSFGDVEVVNERYVHDGNLITSAGVSAGIDMALYLVGLLSGPETGRLVQKHIEYYPKPPEFSDATT